MIARYSKLIIKAVEKFNLKLKGKHVLTEAATDNYVCTPVIAAFAGAEVTAFTRDSKYGTVDEVIRQTYELAEKMSVLKKIKVITDLDETNWEKIDIVTNTGHLRPIDHRILNNLRSDVVIPLMYEPWEFREGEIDIDLCRKKGIRICGTNESDPRLRTIDYLGHIVLFFLMKEKRSPFSTSIIITGTDKFTESISKTLKYNDYPTAIKKLDELTEDFSGADVLVITDHSDGQKILSGDEASILRNSNISRDKLIIHICGNVDFKDANYKHYPEIPAKFGYMSYTTDLIDPMAVIDLHTAGLKVAEGLIKYGKDILNQKEYPVLFIE